MKQLIQDSQDPYLALLSYRTTPFSWSPAELLMGWRLQTSMPQLGEHLSPKWPDLEEF